MWFVYLLLCGDKSIYTGITNDVQKRLAAHKNGRGGAYTRSRGADKIVYMEKFATRSEALTREAEIKKLSRKDKLALIRTK